MRKLSLLLAGLAFLGLVGIASAAPTVNLFRNIWPETDSTYYSGTTTNAWLGVVTDELCLTGDSCRTTWPTGGGGGATTTIAGLTPANGVFILNGSSTSATGLTISIATTSPRTITVYPELQAGYTIPLSASTTNWQNFFVTPSTRITDGNNLTWSGNTLNVDDVFPTYSYASSTFVSFTYASTTFPNVTLAGQNYLSLSGQQITANAVNLASSNVTGVLPVANGGTGTNTLASLTVGSNLSISGGQNVLIGTSTQISLGAAVVTTLATGTTGTIFNGSIGSNTLTLNLPLASGAATGQLQAADWLTFNNKLSGSLSGSQIVYATGASTTAGSNLLTFATDTGLAVTATSTLATTTIAKLTVSGQTTLGSASTSHLTISGNTYLTGLTGQNCIGTSASGLLQAGSCGGSGNSAWTIGNGLIYNATSTDLVGVGTITPTTTLFVQGKAGTNPFAIASSTGTQLLTMTQAGKLGIGTTTPQTGLSVVNTVTSDYLILSGVSDPQITFRADGVSKWKAIGTTDDFQIQEDATNNPIFFATWSTNKVTTAFDWVFDANRVAIGTTSTSSALTVQGYAGSNPFTITSTTGATLFQVAQNASATIGSLTAANCDVKSTTGGQLYCGTDQTGAAQGNAAWTILSGAIHNATSTDEVGIGTSTPDYTLTIQGNGSTQPFRIASSTGTNLLTLNTDGNLTVAGSLTLGTDLTVANGGTGVSTLTDHGVLVGSGAAAIDALAVGTNGQLLVGSTGADPVFATANCGSNLTCTLGAGTFQIDLDNSISLSGTLDVTGTSTLATTTVTKLTATTINGGTLSGNNSGDVTLTGENYLSISSQQITAADINLTSGANVTGVLPVANGGTATSTSPVNNNQILGWNNASYGPVTLVNGTQITITTSTPGQITIANGYGTAIDPTELASSDFGDFSCNGSTCTLDATYLTTIGSGNRGFGARWNGTNTLAQGALMDNGTVVGVNATTSNVALTVQGIAGSNNAFIVSSSTGDALLTIAPTGSTTIANLNAANCDVKSSGGALYCGTDQSSGLSGGTNGYVTRWTSASAVSTGILLDNNAVAGVNATSSSYAFNIQGTGSVHPLQVGTSTFTNMLVVRGDSGNVGINTSTPTKTFVVDTADGSVRIGDVDPPTGGASDAGVMFNGNATSSESAVFTELNGKILSMGINVDQVTGSRNTSFTGGIFRFDTRNGGASLNGDSHAFVVKFVPTGGAETNGLIIDLEDGNTALAPAIGNVGIATTAPTTTLFLQGRAGVNPFAIASSTGSQFVTVTQNGNFGINTTTPSSKLTVVGTALIQGSSDQIGFNVFSNGNVGIGDTSNSARFTVGSSEEQAMYLRNSGGYQAEWGWVGGNTNRIAFGAWRAGSRLSNILVLDPDNGFVGVGTGTPNYMLSVRALNENSFNITDASGNPLLEARNISATSTISAIAGSFADTASYFSEDFNSDILAATTADSAAVGDDSSWYFDATDTDCTATQADIVPGVVRLASTAASGCLVGFGTAQNNLSLIFQKSRFPIVQMKVKDSDTSNSNDIVLGLGDMATATTTNDTLPANGIFFWPNNGTSWVGVVRSGGSNVGTVTCPGTISNTAFQALRIEVISLTSVRFLVDVNADDGVSFTSCGTVSGAGPTGALGAFMNIAQTSANPDPTIDLDYFRVWQH